MMGSPNAGKLKKGFGEVAKTAVPYFAQWTFNEPLIIRPETDAILNKIQKLLYKAVIHFGNEYRNYLHLVPFSDEILNLLAFYKDRPYQPNLYRPDFLIDEANKVRLIEITCRFPLNGIFISGFFNTITEKYVSERPYLTHVNHYQTLFDYLMDYIGNFEHICYLIGDEQRNESKYALPIFEKAGFKVYTLSPGEIPQNLHLLRNAAVFNELNSSELFSLPENAFHALIDAGMMNDLRTVFLIHDKRFFSLFQKNEFLQNIFTPEEQAFISEHIVPTYTSIETPDLWQEAKNNKDSWIIKNSSRGKSIDVYAGIVIEEQEWQRLFSGDNLKNMILQPYVKQRKFPGYLNDKFYNDYIVGIILMYNDQYFGPGVVRASSFPITNRVDDRKFAPLVTKDYIFFDERIII